METLGRERERERERERLTDWLNFYYTRIEVGAQMPVRQPVLDVNYKHLQMIRTWPKTILIKTIITIAIIVAYRGKNSIKCLQKNKANKETKTGGRGRRRWERERESILAIFMKHGKAYKTFWSHGIILASLSFSLQFINCISCNNFLWLSTKVGIEMKWKIT